MGVVLSVLASWFCPRGNSRNKPSAMFSREGDALKAKYSRDEQTDCSPGAAQNESNASLLQGASQTRELVILLVYDWDEENEERVEDARDRDEDGEAAQTSCG